MTNFPTYSLLYPGLLPFALLHCVCACVREQRESVYVCVCCVVLWNQHGTCLDFRVTITYEYT